MDYQHLTKDRSLGYAELHLNELAAEAESEEYPYKSTGKKTEAAYLKLDKETFKGQLHYEAEFIPALALKDFNFSTSSNHIQQAVNGAANEGEIRSHRMTRLFLLASRLMGPSVRRGRRIMSRMRNPRTLALRQIDESDSNSIIESPAESEGKPDPHKGVVMSKEELMQHRKRRRSSSLLNISQWLQNPELLSSTSLLLSSRKRLGLRFCWMMHTGLHSPLPWPVVAT
jgi:hypothetical protein